MTHVQYHNHNNKWTTELPPSQTNLSGKELVRVVLFMLYVCTHPTVHLLRDKGRDMHHHITPRRPVCWNRMTKRRIKPLFLSAQLPAPLPSPPWGTQEPINCMRGPQPLNRNMYHMTVVISGACHFANDVRLTMTNTTASCFSSARTEQFCLQLCTSHLCWPKNTAKKNQKQKQLESLHSTDSSASTVEQSLIARCGERRCQGGGRGGGHNTS